MKLVERLNRHPIIFAISVLSGILTIVSYCSSNPTPKNPVRHRPSPMVGETEYRKLASPAFCRGFIGKSVIFRAQYLSEWTDVAGYQLMGVDTKNRVFLNHRDVDYAVTSSPLGPSDNEFPPFPLSVPGAQANLVYALNKNDLILVEAQVKAAQPPPALAEAADFARVNLFVTSIKKIDVQ